MRIRLHPRIKHDLAQAIDHYNNCAPGLGEDFLAEFVQRVAAISDAPLLWSAGSSDIRRALLKRFRYAIYFRIVASDMVLVLVLKHQRRHPKSGLTRRH